jgi:hypothetical protein
MEDFNRKISDGVKIQLLKQIGMQYKTITQNLKKLQIQQQIAN